MALKVLLSIEDLEKLCCLKNIFKMSWVCRRPWKALLKTKDSNKDYWRLKQVFWHVYTLHSSSDYRALRKAFPSKAFLLIEYIKKSAVFKINSSAREILWKMNPSIEDLKNSLNSFSVYRIPRNALVFI